MNYKKIIKYTKPTSDPLIIGAPGGVNVVKKAPPSAPQQITGGLLIGTTGVIKQESQLHVQTPRVEVQDRSADITPPPPRWKSLQKWIELNLPGDLPEELILLLPGQLK